MSVYVPEADAPAVVIKVEDSSDDESLVVSCASSSGKRARADMEKSAADVMESQHKKLRANTAVMETAAAATAHGISSSSADSNEPCSEHQQASADIALAITIMECRRREKDLAPENWDPIRKAVWYDDPHTLKLLLSDARYSSTIDKPVRNVQGYLDDRSALYHAVQNEQHLCVKLLLQARADPHKQSRWKPRTPGRPWVTSTPLDAARKLSCPRGRRSMLDVFEEVCGCPAPPLPLTPVALQCGGALYL